VSTDDHDEKNLYGRGDSAGEERARKHEPTGVMDSGAAVKLRGLLLLSNVGILTILLSG